MKEKSIGWEDVVPESFKLKYYSDKEANQLSVVKIYSPVTFNTLGHALSGGLYDLAMGPISEKGKYRMKYVCYFQWQFSPLRNRREKKLVLLYRFVHAYEHTKLY